MFHLTLNVYKHYLVKSYDERVTLTAAAMAVEGNIDNRRAYEGNSLSDCCTERGQLLFINNVMLRCVY